MPDLVIPNVAPTCVPQLSRLDWKREFNEFENVFVDPNWTFGPWVLALHLNGPGKGDGFDVPALPISASGFQFTFDSGSGNLGELGRWDWQVWALHATEKNRVVERGSFDHVLGFLEGASGIDTSTHASRMLAIIEARLEGRITRDAESYSIGGRSLSRIPIEELKGLRKEYRVERAVEVRLAEAGVQSGRRRIIRVGF